MLPLFFSVLFATAALAAGRDTPPPKPLKAQAGNQCTRVAFGIEADIPVHLTRVIPPLQVNAEVDLYSVCGGRVPNGAEVRVCDNVPPSVYFTTDSKNADIYRNGTPLFVYAYVNVRIFCPAYELGTALPPIPKGK